MGQRTFILLKKNYRSTTGEKLSNISLMHHQWGIGKCMLALFLQELMKAMYPLDRSLQSNYYNIDAELMVRDSLERIKASINRLIIDEEGLLNSEDLYYLQLPISKHFNFLPLNSLNNNYYARIDKEQFEKLGLIFPKGNERVYPYYKQNSHDVDMLREDISREVTLFNYPCKPSLNIFSPKVIQAYSRLTDNNNGCMLVEVTQVYENGRPETITSKAFEVKISFCTGSEEETLYEEGSDYNTEGRNIYFENINPSFTTLFSPTFYSNTTYKHKSSIAFANYFTSICKMFGVKVFYNRKAEKELKDKYNSLCNIAEGLLNKGFTSREVQEEINKMLKPSTELLNLAE